MPQITLHIQPSFQVPGKERCFSGTPFAITVERLKAELSTRPSITDWLARVDARTRTRAAAAGTGPRTGT